MESMWLWFAELVVEVSIASVLALVFARYLLDVWQRDPSDELLTDDDALPTPERVSFVDGLKAREEKAEEDALQEEVEEVLDWIAAAAPAGHPTPEVCSCVRPEGDGFVGVVRLHTDHCHSVHVFRAPSRKGVALSIIEECSGWKGLPRCDASAEECEECNRSVCPAGGRLSVAPPKAA